MQRDGYRPDDGRSQPRDGEPLVDFLNRLNDEWETGTRRLSPKALTDRGVEAPPGAVVSVIVTGEASGNWHVEGRDGGWEQTAEPRRTPLATVTMDQDMAWRLVTKRRTPETVRHPFPDVWITGDEALGQTVLRMVSVMA